MELENLFSGEELIPEVYIVAIGEKAQAKVAQIISLLRYNNISVEFDPDKTSLKAQMKAADKIKAKYAVILGEDELERGVVTLKYLLHNLYTCHHRGMNITSISNTRSSVKNNTCRFTST